MNNKTFCKVCGNLPGGSIKSKWTRSSMPNLSNVSTTVSILDLIFQKTKIFLIFENIHTNERANTHTYIHTYIHTYTYIRIRNKSDEKEKAFVHYVIFVHRYICAYILYTYTHIHTHTYIHKSSTLISLDMFAAVVRH